MSDLVLDASLALQWFLDDETNREYSLAILQRLTEKRALVPTLWFYEVGNGLVMANRRGRISAEQVDGFVKLLSSLPIDVAPHVTSDALSLPSVARNYGLTSYDAAYLSLALGARLPLATTDSRLRSAASAAGVSLA